MRALKVYCRPGQTPPLAAFLGSLDGRLAEKTIRQIFRLADMPVAMMKEPHVKHFVIERYSQLYELREKNRILVRIIFTIYDGDILFLAPFIKRQKRDAMQALEASLNMLADVRADPAFAVNFYDLKEELM